MDIQESTAHQKKHLVEIDYLRCFAILAVIAIHTAAALTRVENPANFFAVSIWQNISSFAVPLFICISGFVLYLSYNPKLKGNFYQKRFQRIIPPYLIFTVIFLIANIFKSYVVTGVFQLPSFGTIINAFLFATSNEHMWFFLIIIELYLLYPILSSIYSKLAEKNIDWILLIAGFIIQIFWNTFSGNLAIFINGADIYLSNKIFLCMIFYFIFGMYMSKHYSFVCRILSSATAFALLIIGVILTAVLAFNSPSGSFYTVPAIAYCTSAILLLFAVSRILVSVSQENIFVTIGLYSFGIYLIHPLIQGLFGYVIYPALTITPETMMYYPAVFFTTTVLSGLAVHIIKKMPYNKYIIG